MISVLVEKIVLLKGDELDGVITEILSDEFERIWLSVLRPYYTKW